MCIHLKFGLCLFSLSILCPSSSRPNFIQDTYVNDVVTKDASDSITPLLTTNHRIRRQSLTLKDPPSITYETWGGHTDKIFLVHFDPDKHVVVYFASTFGPVRHWRFHVLPATHWTYHGDASWLFKFVPRIWGYMKREYGNYGPDPYIYLVVHQGEHSLPYHEYSLQTDKTNLLDISSPKNDGWLTGRTRSTEMDTIINELGFFVELSSKNRLHSPTYNLWKDLSSSKSHTGWTDIFTFDVYTSLNMTADAGRIKAKLKNKFQKNGGNNTYWFRDWLLPIYENYGGTRTLNEYFEVLSFNLPYDGHRYQYELNLGEFVYFWSTAAKADLRDLAKGAFLWTDDNEEEFLNATMRFSAVTQVPPIVQVSEPSKSVNSSSSVIGRSIGGAIVSILIVLLIGSFIFYKRKIKTLQTKIQGLTKDEVKDFFDGDSSLKPDEAQALVLSSPFIRDFEIPLDRIICDHSQVLGSGEFGSVIYGSLRPTENNDLSVPIPVALKTVKRNVDVIYFKSFLSEVKIMAYLGNHGNIVQLLGTCMANIKNLEIFIALEYCPLRSLENFLKNNRDSFITETGVGATLTEKSLTTLNCLQWSQEISNGMMYLTQKKVIHGDLAARNVLLTDTRIAKLSDFGLSRQFLNYANYMKTSKTPVPWRWLSIEALKEMKFSTASDVWAFGVTMWEIFSLGEVPYGALTYDLYFADKLSSGDRLLAPKHANQHVYELLNDCWKLEPAQRPTFQQVHNLLSEMISDLSVS